jgi:2-dehydro-3-deoxygluconokinase
MALDILSFGEAMIEFNQRPGTRDWYQGFGGDTCNTAIAARRLGARTGYFTALGADAFGGAIRDLLAREDVDASTILTFPEAHTAVYFVTHGPEGHAFSYLRAGSAASRVTPAHLPLEAIRSARILHASAISQAISPNAADAVFAAMDACRAAGGTVSYDTNLRLKLWPLARARAIIEEAARFADILLPGLDDAQLLTGLEAPEAICDHYLARGVKIVALTLGSKGALVATPERREFIAPISCKPVDATGAGDAYDGAFLAEWLVTGDAFAAGRFANTAAGISVEGYGAIEPLPSREAVLTRL